MVAATPLLRVRELRVVTRSQRATTALVSSATLHVDVGEIVCLVGPSGAGKTLTLRAILGALPRTCDVSGEITWRGRHTSTFTAHERRAWWGRDVAYLPQAPADTFTPMRRVGAQICEVLRHHQPLDRTRARAQAAQVFVRLGLDPELLDAYPHQLSGGQVQRAAIARAVVCGPSLLIADEPTTGLDAEACDDFHALLTRLRLERGLSILLVTHEAALVERLADRVVVMQRGATVDDTTRHPFGSRTLAATRVSALRVRRATGWRREALLEAQHISVTHARGGWWRRTHTPLLKDATVRVHRGERVAIVGPSGAGKSTLARCLALLDRPSSGRVIVGGNDAWQADDHRLRALRRRVQLVFQDPTTAVNPRFSALDTVCEPLVIGGIADANVLRDEGRRLLADVGIDPDAGNRRIGTFSGGEQQRITIARALATSPEALILDEPFTFLDRGSRDRLGDLLLELSVRRSMALIVIAHDPEVVIRLADDVYVVTEGNVASRAAVEEHCQRAAAHA